MSLILSIFFSVSFCVVSFALLIADVILSFINYNEDSESLNYIVDYANENYKKVYELNDAIYIIRRRSYGKER